ncbi:hypothetical protein SAMN05421767_1262 [Granulicatella balaenopterae]|uniref:Uncharacterized protein n=1 Tax=Granulicatella balaenopterae TaxID=137733 RepID=A0A1H9MBV1_9LACT|nr:hypothetical protein [Granulicatella balaenopterae]SER21240.1 hypothetical protein SAMN05421767_1262 [Granulicatella balaenopterae]
MLASRKHTRLRIGLVVIIIGLIGIFWYRSPRTIIENDSSTIAEVHIKNGQTGESLSIKDPQQIDYLINNMNKGQLKRDGLSLGQMGYRYHITLFAKESDDIIGWDSFMINSSEVIRKDPFFYQVEYQLIDLNYIENLFTK